MARGGLSLLCAAHALRGRVGALHGTLRSALRREARLTLQAHTAPAASAQPGAPGAPDGDAATGAATAPPPPRSAAQQAAARQLLASLDADGGADGGGAVAPLGARMSEVP